MTKNCHPQVGYCLLFLSRTLSLSAYFNIHLFRSVQGIDFTVIGTESEFADIIVDTNKEIYPASGKRLILILINYLTGLNSVTFIRSFTLIQRSFVPITVDNQPAVVKKVPSISALYFDPL